MRKVLFVAYFFPPVGGVSVPRTLGFLRHLPAHGWRPTVLTPRRSSHHLKDAGGIAAIPTGTRVVRTGIVEPGDIMRLVRHIRAFRSADHVSGGEGHVPAPQPDLSRWRRIFFFPDDHIGWVPWAVLAGLRRHRQTPFDALYSSSSPITAHIVAGMLARITGVPWVAEFRDPWVGNALAPKLPWFHRALARRIERWIIRSAHACVFVTPSLTALYRHRYPAWAERFETVTNGYDLPVDGRPKPAARRRDASAATIVYTGTADRPDELRIFLEGLGAWHARQPDRRLAVEFIGHASDRCRELLEGAADAAGPGSVRSSGFVPRAVAAERLATADAALVLLGTGPGMGLFVSGKLFDYIGADVPVFAVVPPGDAEAILRELGWGVVASPQPEAIADGLDQILGQGASREVADPERRYERRAIVAGLAAVLDRAASGPGP